MARWLFHLAVLGVLFVLAAFESLSDLSRHAFLRGLFTLIVMSLFASYSAVTTGAVAIFRLTPRGVTLLHGTLIATAMVGASIRVAIIKSNQNPAIEGRKVELKRWWIHTLYAPAGAVYAEVQADFDGTVNLSRFSATAAGQPVIQSSEGQRYMPVRRGQTVVLELGYSRTGEDVPDSFVLSLQLASELSGRTETVDYATDFASRRSTASLTNRPLPPASEDPDPPPVLPLPPPRAVISLGKPEFDPSALDGQKLQAYVASRRSGLQQCFMREQRRPAIETGNVSVRFSITPAGRVSGIAIEENTLGNEAVATCIRINLHGWVFPFKPIAEVSVLYPFHFESAGGMPVVPHAPMLTPGTFIP